MESTPESLGGEVPTLPPKELTLLLADWSRGDQRALERLTPLVYEELRSIAKGYLRRERTGHTLQPTALIHEAYLRLVGQSLPSWESRTHFYGVAAQLMRQILVDHARGRLSRKRGGGAAKASLDEAAAWALDRPADLVALDDALRELAGLDARKCRAIELHYFGGLKVEEIAGLLGVSVATVGRELRLAKAWLARAMGGGTEVR